MNVKQQRFQFYRFSLIAFALLLFFGKAQAQIIGVKTNVPAWATASLNAGVELGFADQWSFEVNGLYNPFSWSEGKKTKVWAVQPEIRFWTIHRFAGHFLGIHAHYAMYDYGLKKYRYKGELYGVGFAYGYAWMINKRFNIEATLGFGYTRVENEYRYDRKDSQIYLPPDPHDYWGLSKAAISISYFLK